MSKYKLNIYQIQEKETLDVNLICLKDKIETIMKIDETVSDAPAAHVGIVWWLFLPETERRTV